MKKRTILIVVLLVLGTMLTYLQTSSATTFMDNKIIAMEIENTIIENENQIILVGNNTCQACKEFKPILQKAIDQTNSKVFYLDSDNSKNESFLKKYEINGTPTLLIIKKGKLLRYEGILELEETKVLLEGELSNEK